MREHLEHAEQARAAVPLLMGILRACYAVAWTTVGPLLAVGSGSRDGYPAIFQAAAALFVVFAAGVIAFVPRAVSGSGGQADSRSRGDSGRLRARERLRVRLDVRRAAFTLTGLNLPLFLTEKLAATEHGVGAAFAVSPPFEILFMVGFGHLAALGHQRRVILVGASAAVGYFAALPFVTAVWHVYPLQVLNAAAHAVTTSVAIPFFQDLMPGQPGAAKPTTRTHSKRKSARPRRFGLLASYLEEYTAVLGLRRVCVDHALRSCHSRESGRWRAQTRR
jgi:SET family sugar efflux transporter-like MFS transporter